MPGELIVQLCAGYSMPIKYPIELDRIGRNKRQECHVIFKGLRVKDDSSIRRVYEHTGNDADVVAMDVDAGFFIRNATGRPIRFQNTGNPINQTHYDDGDPVEEFRPYDINVQVSDDPKRKYFTHRISTYEAVVWFE